MHQKIKQIRKQRGFTMKKLAESIGTSQQQIDRLEKGKRRMTLEWMDRLSSALDCNITDLLPPSHQSRDSKTSKTKVIGAINSKSKIDWFEETEIYSLLFGRPKNITNPRMFALVVEADNIAGFSRGSELIFSEVNSEEIKNGKTVLCSGDNGHFLDKTPTGSKVKAVLIKTIRDE